MSDRLAGQIAIVTGAESGIGLATALLFAAEGARVGCTFHQDNQAAAAAQQRIGGGAFYLQTDVSNEGQVDALFDRCLHDFGKPTILVNCAGINSKGICVKDMSLEHWRSVIDTNLTGPFLCSRRFARDVDSSRGGRIINVTSIHEDVAIAGGAEYCASKGGLRNLTRCLALELAGQGITVNNLAPGMILTEMNEASVENPEVRKEHAEHIPLKRAGTVDEVAQVALFLASPDSAYVTGTTFFVDGGLMLNLGQGA